MVQIAFLPWESSISADELHSLVGVPRDYLSKILRKLVAAGLLIGEKGHRGGFRLASPPSRITFLQIFQALGLTPTQGKTRQCAYGWGVCDNINPCPLHGTFTELYSQFNGWASGTTLADITPPTRTLLQIRGQNKTENRQAKGEKSLPKIHSGKRSR